MSKKLLLQVVQQTQNNVPQHQTVETLHALSSTGHNTKSFKMERAKVEVREIKI